MKPWLGVGSRSILFLPALLALGTGCSSSSSGAGPADSGTNAGDAGMAMPTFEGDGAACPMNTAEIVGSKITLNVTWPETLANAGCNEGMTPPCTGQIFIWLLAKYSINGTTVTGTTETCGNQTPPIPLSVAGTLSEGLPATQTATVQVGFAPSVWTSIIANPNKAPTQTAGVLGGWNIGSSFTIQPTNSYYGLASTSTFANPMTVWPASQSSIPTTDLTDDDNDGKPGITGTPSTANGYSLPATAQASMAPFPPQADELYLTLRTDLSLYGTSSSCTDISGKVNVQLLNNHVVGCHIVEAGDCTMDQWNFIDQNTTVYVGPGVTIPPNVQAPSFAPPGITGTFVAKILSTDPDGGGVDCSTVLSTFQ